MLVKQYTHRLPADYDMGIIRARAAAHSAQWDSMPDLAFKAFAARVRGEHGAAANAYSSVYLWLRTEAAADFIMGPRFDSVTDSFGRPRIETWLPFDARRGRAAHAMTLYREDVALPDTADRDAVRRAECERDATLALRNDTLAVVTAVDPLAWRLARLTLSAEPPDASHPGTAYQIFHLARPGLHQLR